MGLTVRNRLLLALAGMLVPLVILSVTIFVSLSQAVDAVQEILVDPIAEINETMHLQSLLHQAMMPANDYLIHGSLSERNQFRQMEAKIEKQFAHVRNNNALLAIQKKLLASAYKEWKLAREMSLGILGLEQPVGHRLGARTMEQMDILFRNSAEFVDQMHSNAQDTLREGSKLTEKVKRTIERTIIFVTLTGLTIMLIIEYLVVRSILQPVQKLEEAVHGIAKGDYDRQVSIKTDDEFGRLATSFNEMATNLKKARNQLEQLSMQDGLTGILNRRALEQSLKSEISRAERFGNEFSLVMFDIDNFKQVNDSYGHLFGDDVLISVTREVEKHIRPIDQFGRYGGEEFIVIMPETGIEGAAKSAERLRMMIETVGLKDEQGQIVPVSASFGVACMPEEAASESELLGLADKRLYRAKHEGRNRIVSSDQDIADV